MRTLPLIALCLLFPAGAMAGTTSEPPPEEPTTSTTETTPPESGDPEADPALEEGAPPPPDEVTIAIDPGHGGRDPGAIALLGGAIDSGLPQRRDGRGRALLLEKDVNLDVARRLRAWLRRRGYNTVMTRTRDRAGGDKPYTTERADLRARVAIANEAPATLFVSVHMNSSLARSARGAETYRFTVSQPATIGLAGSIQERLVGRTGLPGRGVKRAGFYVLKHTTMPAVLVEGGFLSNPTDRALLTQRRFRAQVAAGIGEGVHTYILEGGSLDTDDPALAIRYWVHAGQFRRLVLARRRVALLRRRGFDAVVARRYSVRANRVMFFAVAGRFAMLDNAKRLRSELRAARLPGIIGPPG